MRRQRTIAGWVLIACVAGTTLARADEAIEFARDIQPLFQKHCLKCHGGVRRAGGLSLLAARGSQSGGDSGKPLVVAGKAEEGELIRRVTAEDPDERMPAESPPLTADEITRLRRWIEQGARWPTHWSFAPLGTALPPVVSNTAWARSAIDHFVQLRLSQLSLAPSPEADRFTLIRRLSLDLLGLPATPEEAEGFVAHKAPDAYERLVDRLLANPHFGERWGRHWLDQARYADSDGYEVDKPRPDAYRWRDWVIEAVNRDMPLDQFTIEQFAGDLMPGATPLTQLATAYHRQTLTNNEGGVDKEEYRLKAVLDRVANTGSVWLGLTLGCAQCHDHPYDPFTQREFYAMAAIFNSADETEIELGDGTSGKQKAQKFRVLGERDTPRQTRLLKRGEFLNPGDEIAAGLPSPFAATPHSAFPALHSVPTRLDLARWLVDSGNPLTPRVVANLLWLHLFGQGLVRTTDDFGARGQPPTHPELLDWLSGQLINRGWSRKDLIRQIVTSATYRQASRHRPELAAVDPQNTLLARQNRIRVEAEVFRDLHFAAGGLLTSKIGGPSVFPPLGAEFVKITFRSELPWKTSTGEDRYRRGMYTFFKRSVPYPDLMIFDCPDASTAVVQRAVSNTPLQALTSLNSETCLEAARGLAAQVNGRVAEKDSQRVEWMFRACLTRPVTAAEAEKFVQLHRTHRQWYETHPDDAAAMAMGLASEKGAVDAAALVATANILMNLDEFVTRE
jgi:hypothetical protein